MAVFNIDFNQFKPSSLGKPTPKPQALPTAAPVVKQQVPPIPKPVPTPPAPSYQPQKQDNLIEKGFKLLSVPSEKTEQFLTHGKGYETALENSFGLKKGTTPNKVASFVSRLVYDPLNIIPIAKVGQGIKWGVKGLQALSGGAKVAKTVDTASDIARTGNFVTNAIQKIPGVERFGKSFIKGYGLPKEYDTATREIFTKAGTKLEETRQAIEGAMKTKPSRQALESVPKFLEQKGTFAPGGKFIPGAGTGVDIKGLVDDLGDEFTKIRPLLNVAKQTTREQVYDLVRSGRMTGEQAKQILKAKSYFPRNEFVNTGAKKLFDIIPRFGVKEKYLKPRKGVAPISKNPAASLLRREAEQVLDMATNDFFQFVKTTYGSKWKAGQDIAKGYKVFVDPPKRLGMFRNVQVPKNIYDDLVSTYSKDFTGAKAIDLFNRYWKPTATAWNPAFHIMNVMGNLYNIALSGTLNPKTFARAVMGGFNPAEKTLLKKSGILTRGQFAEDIFGQFAYKNIAQHLGTGVRSYPRRFGNMLENNARSSLFLENYNRFISRGLSQEQAISQAKNVVNKFLFDYLSGLTPFEAKYMRRLFPFYTWARFNIPLQLKSLVTAPHIPATVAKVKKQLEPEGEPPLQYPGISFPTPLTDSEGRKIRYRPNLPVQDIFELNPVTRAKQMLSPVIKEGIELGRFGLTGEPPRDWFTGRERTTKGLPLDMQLKEIGESEVQSLLRPARTFSKLSEEQFNVPSIIRDFIVGGFYRVPKDQRKQVLFEKQQKQNAFRQARTKIMNDSKLSNSEKLRQIRELEKRLLK